MNETEEVVLEPEDDLLFVTSAIQVELLLQQLVPNAQQLLAGMLGQKLRPLLHPFMHRELRPHRPANERFAEGNVPSRNTGPTRQGRRDVAVVEVDHGTRMIAREIEAS